MRKFNHQAFVRRSVVVALIAAAKARGHRAYRNVDMGKVKKKAEELPEGDVPECLVRLLPYERSLDKIVIQKAACPVSGGSTVEGAGERLRDEKPNGVVGEKSSFDDADINAQRIAALRHLCAELGQDVLNSEANHAQFDRHQEDQGTSDGTLSEEEIAQLPASQRKRARREPRQFVAEAAQDVRKEKIVERKLVCTGNQMVDQFEPWYFGIAFAFVWPACGQSAAPMVEILRCDRTYGKPFAEHSLGVIRAVLVAETCL